MKGQCDFASDWLVECRLQFDRCWGAFDQTADQIQRWISYIRHENPDGERAALIINQLTSGSLPQSATAHQPRFWQQGTGVDRELRKLLGFVQKMGDGFGFLLFSDKGHHDVDFGWQDIIVANETSGAGPLWQTWYKKRDWGNLWDGSCGWCWVSSPASSYACLEPWASPTPWFSHQKWSQSLQLEYSLETKNYLDSVLTLKILRH